LSPSIWALMPVSCSTRMIGRGLMVPALIRVA
jgi:hypothetical protein